YRLGHVLQWAASCWNGSVTRRYRRPHKRTAGEEYLRSDIGFDWKSGSRRRGTRRVSSRSIRTEERQGQVSEQVEGGRVLAAGPYARSIASRDGREARKDQGWRT